MKRTYQATPKWSLERSQRRRAFLRGLVFALQVGLMMLFGYLMLITLWLISA